MQGISAPLDAWRFEVPENFLNSSGVESWLLENTPL
jgi:hypothetical protein